MRTVQASVVLYFLTLTKSKNKRKSTSNIKAESEEVLWANQHKKEYFTVLGPTSSYSLRSDPNK